MKRTVLLNVMLALLIILFLAGCSSEPAGTVEPEGQEPLRVIATIFPQYDFIRHIAGDRVDLSMLISPGAESHGFEPTPRDIIAINSADLLVYVGGHGDVWVEPILTSLGRDDMRTVALLDLVDAVMTEHQHHGHDHDHHHSHDYHHSHDHDDHDCDDHDDDCEEDDYGYDHHHSHDHHHGHDHDHDCDDHDEDCEEYDHDHDHNHSHDHHHGHGHHHHHEPHYDEHVWTCPRNAILIVRALTEVLAEMDAANAYYFRQNAESFISVLNVLDMALVEAVANGVRTTVVFGDRFPFHYLMDTYGLTAYAAFDGCSAETQASPATIAFLIDKVNNENIPVVFYLEFSTRLIANVIAEATGARLLEMHSVHNVSQADFNAGVTYVELMWRNVEMLREALS